MPAHLLVAQTLPEAKSAVYGGCACASRAGFPLRLDGSFARAILRSAREVARVELEGRARGGFVSVRLVLFYE